MARNSQTLETTGLVADPKHLQEIFALWKRRYYAANPTKSYTNQFNHVQGLQEAKAPNKQKGL